MSNIYPEADHASQWFHKSYPGDVMPHPNVIVLHTTEGSSWPSYASGSEAPNFTIKGGSVRQHFNANESSRALVNSAGGVETNTLNVIQIELVGTCAKGGPGLFWPNASDEDMKALVSLVKWLTDTYPIPVVSTEKSWLSYPSSYANAKGQRMSFAEWEAFSGICGHQHVPENVHGDPGNFPIKRLIELVKGAKPATSSPQEPPAAPTTTPAPKVSRSKVTINGLEYGYGAKGSQVTQVGKALVSKGFGKFYTSGPGPDWTDADTKNYQLFQKSLGYTGTDADGVPGETSLKKLLGTLPKPSVSMAHLISAAKTDPSAKQGHTTFPDDVEIFEAALKAEGLLSATYSSDGSFGSTTIAATAKWQKECGFSGKDANGQPGMVTTKKLGTKHGFIVKP